MTTSDLELLAEAAKRLERAYLTGKEGLGPAGAPADHAQVRTPKPVGAENSERDLEAAAGKLLAGVDQLLSGGELHCLQARADALRHILYRRARKNCLPATSDVTGESD